MKNSKGSGWNRTLALRISSYLLNQRLNELKPRPRFPNQNIKSNHSFLFILCQSNINETVKLFSVIFFLFKISLWGLGLI
jgi:hypothetical protein